MDEDEWTEYAEGVLEQLANVANDEKDLVMGLSALMDNAKSRREVAIEDLESDGVFDEVPLTSEFEEA